MSVDGDDNVGIAWPQVPLSSLVDESRGISYGIVQPGRNLNDGVPVVRVNNLKGGPIDLADVLRVDPEIEAQYKRTRLQGGEVLISLVGSLGLSAVASQSMLGWNVARAIAVVPVKQDVGSRWVNFCLQTPELQHRMLARATTTVQATLNLRDVRELPIPMPPKAVRDEISHFLGTLDDKIELNRQMNQTLDEIARTLFRSWFVDFDPVRAKAEGRQPEGMDAETAALFPDRLVNSDLGPIPEGWEVATLGDIVGLSKTAVRPDQSPDEVFDHYSIPAFDNGQTPVREAGRQIKSGKYQVPADAVLVSKLNPHIQRVWLPNLENDARSISSTEFLVVTTAHPFGKHFLFNLICSEPFQHAFQSRVTGTTGSHQRVSPASLLSIPIVVPTCEPIAGYERQTKPIFDLAANNRRESQTLADLRDILLPELLSGKLSLP